MRKEFSEKRIAFAYEAGPTGYGLYDDLIEEGFVCLVADGFQEQDKGITGLDFRSFLQSILEDRCVYPGVLGLIGLDRMA